MSLSWSAVYVRGQLPASPLPTEGEVAVRALGPWTELGLAGPGDAAPFARAISKQRSGEVVAIDVQTTADVFSLVHWEAGEERRRLVFAGGRWVAVRGSPRAWERALYGRDGDDVREGDTSPRPAPLATLAQALGVTEREWQQAHANPADAVLRGALTSPLTRLVRAGAVVTLGVLGAAVASSGDTRAALGALGLVLCSTTAVGAALRRLRLGRWRLW